MITYCTCCKKGWAWLEHVGNLGYKFCFSDQPKVNLREEVANCVHFKVLFANTLKVETFTGINVRERRWSKSGFE